VAAGASPILTDAKTYRIVAGAPYTRHVVSAAARV